MSDDKYLGTCLTIAALGLMTLIGYGVHSCHRSDVDKFADRAAMAAAERLERQRRQEEGCAEFTYVPIDPEGADCPPGMEMDQRMGGFGNTEVIRVDCRCPEKK